MEILKRDGYPTRWLYKGVHTDPYFAMENLDSIQEYEPSAGEVYVSTYVKGGTMWTQDIVYQLLYGKPIDNVNDFDTATPWLWRDGAEKIMQFPKPRLIKTHLSPRRDGTLLNLPLNDKARYIYVVRNPLDTAVSHYHHTMMDIITEFNGGEFDKYFEIWMTGEIEYGDYFDHIQAWLPYLKKENVMRIRFEDLKKDLRQEICRITEFLKDLIPAETVVNDAFIDKIVENSCFQGMKKRDIKTESNIWVEGSTGHLRKGKTGTWRDGLTEEHIDQIMIKFKERLGNTEAYEWWTDLGIPENLGKSNAALNGETINGQS